MRDQTVNPGLLIRLGRLACIGWIATFPIGQAVTEGADTAAPSSVAAESNGVGEPAASEDYERWFIAEFQGKRAGWYVERKATSAEHVESSYEMRLTVLRGSLPVVLETSGFFRETHGGEPLAATTTQRSGRSVKQTELIYEADGLRIISRDGAREFTRRVPLPARRDWMTPEQASANLAERLNAGEKRVTFRMMDPLSSLRPVEMTVEVLGEEEIELVGRWVLATKRRQTISNLATSGVVEYVDDEGRMLRTEMNMGGLSLTLISTDEQLAKAQVDPPELLTTTLIETDFTLDAPRYQRRGVFELTLSEGKLPAIPDSAVQRVERLSDTRAIVTVDLDGFGAGQEAGSEAATGRAGEAGAEPGRQQRVRHSHMIDGRDPKVIEIAERASRFAGQDPAAKAEAMRRFVGKYIRSANLSVGMASASEVARVRVGDCTEHAVLLAAMLKAEEIPARVASGLIYVRQVAGRSEVFGYHMWTQAWIDGRWVDLDATGPHESAFDATHILLSTSDLRRGDAANDFVALAPLIGRLSIGLAAGEPEADRDP